MMAIPVERAVRMVLDDVGYTNALPTWFKAHVDLKKRADTIDSLLSKYATQAPLAPFAINVPNRYGGSRRWAVPSVNDQMVLQACALSVAGKVESALDRKKVFSHRLNADPSKSSRFLQDQCVGYAEFLDQAQTRNCTHTVILDLERAFASIDRKKFLDFIREAAVNEKTLQVLERLLQAFSGGDPGIPLVNDSLFYLGNGYFSKVDEEISKHTKDFVRFVDEYCFFATSQKDAESLARTVGRQLDTLGFKVNDAKTKLLPVPPAAKYCPKQQFGASDAGAWAGTSVVSIPKSLSPEQTLQVLELTVQKPGTLLNDGAGRFGINVLNRLRDVLARKSREELNKKLAERPGLLQTGLPLLQKYFKTKDEAWRTVCLIFILKDFDAQKLSDKKTAKDLTDTLQMIEKSTDVPPVAQLWSKNTPVPNVDALVDKLHSANYLDAGKLYYGGH